MQSPLQNARLQLDADLSAVSLDENAWRDTGVATGDALWIAQRILSPKKPPERTRVG
jgi:hypothetical protein